MKVLNGFCELCLLLHSLSAFMFTLVLWKGASPLISMFKRALLHKKNLLFFFLVMEYVRYSGDIVISYNFTRVINVEFCSEQLADNIKARNAPWKTNIPKH